MDTKPGDAVHFVGIGGSGMSPLAALLMHMGYRVSGSDIKDSPKLDKLRSLGAEVHVGHCAENVGGAATVVISAAVSRSNPEVAEATRRGIPVITRAELLGILMNERRGVAITGTHGKSTTTSMTALVFTEAGLDPMVAVGADVRDLGGSSRYGQGEFVIVEADEAYGSFLKLRPEVVVITNVDDDHRDYYGSFEGIVAGFRQFLGNVKPGGFVVAFWDDHNVRTVCEGFPGRIIRYGSGPECDYTAEGPAVRDFGGSFDAVCRGRRLGHIQLRVPGMHNIYNALAVCAVANELGLPFAAVASALGRFSGADRRCQLIGEAGGILVLDDYAHHPAEIAATLKALKQGTGRRVVAVFQPQRYTRTMFLRDQFARAFSDADVVVMDEIYATGTGEEPIPGVSGESLAEAVRAFEGDKVHFVPGKENLLSFLLDAVRPGDVVITMGAGDIWKTAVDLAKALSAGSPSQVR